MSEPVTTPTPARDVPRPDDLTARLPQYEVQTLLGHGGMGAVYRARHRKLDRVVALKVLLPDVGGEPGFADRFEREARALARLDHPGIVRVFDFGDDDGLFYLAMEFVDGASLRDLLAQGRLTGSDALALIPQLCAALQYAHDRGVVHRDIKPENILVDQDGRVRVADFGLAKLLGGDGAAPTLTRESQAVGTPQYMAPEQFRSGAVDHRADIYSLGVVLYEMLTGGLPIGRFAPPSAKAGAEPRFDAVVMKALENEPDRRYQRAQDLQRDLGAEQPGDPAPAADREIRPRPGGRPSRQRAATVDFALLGVVGVACLLRWGVVSATRATFTGDGNPWGTATLPPELFGAVTLDFTPWSGTVVGLPVWLTLVAAVVAGTTRALRAHGRRAPFAASALAAAVGLALGGMAALVLVASPEARIGSGLVLVVAAFTAWLVLDAVQWHRDRNPAGRRHRSVREPRASRAARDARRRRRHGSENR